MKLKLIILLMLGVWLGMILGVSFLEAPLKFRAPNITLVLGLGIGKLVFTALNRIEIIFTIALMIWMLFHYKQMATPLLVVLCCLVALLVIQSLWLLPILNARIDSLLQGIEPAKSHHHFYYVAGEVLKVGLLISGFVQIYKHDRH